MNREKLIELRWLLNTYREEVMNEKGMEAEKVVRNKYLTAEIQELDRKIVYMERSG